MASNDAYRACLGVVKLRSGQMDAGHADLAVARKLDSAIEAHAADYGLMVAKP